MSAYKRNAVIMFPSRRREFESARGVKAILASLENDVLGEKDALARTTLGDQVAAYIRRCLEVSGGGDLERVVIREFLVHWGAEPTLRPYVFKVLAPERFLEEAHEFRQRLETGDFDQLWTEYVGVKLGS